MKKIITKKNKQEYIESICLSFVFITIGTIIIMTIMNGVRML